MEDTERPTRLGSGAWGRRQGLAGLRDDAPSEARGADGERAGGPDGARNTGGAAIRNTGGPAAPLLTNDSGPAPP